MLPKQDFYDFRWTNVETFSVYPVSVPFTINQTYTTMYDDQQKFLSCTQRERERRMVSKVIFGAAQGAETETIYTCANFP